ncbi:MAG: peptide deformylase [Candidatus Nealsonbacteria bacterium]|nr:peptide deformylase [Candidatus Nealsonbacteria bacterium]
MILSIKKYPDPVLRKKCQEVEKVTEEIKKLTLDMLETMIANQGIGLAAPQVGQLKRIIVVHLLEKRSPEEIVAQKPQALINLPSHSEGGRRKFAFFDLPSASEGGRRKFAFFDLPSASERGRRGLALFNPKIIKKSRETITDEEGCLSFPKLFLKIKRAKEVEIEGLNERGEKIKIKTEGLPARVFQHEIDHLDGILFIDHVRVGRRIWELLKFYLRSKK